METMIARCCGLDVHKARLTAFAITATERAQDDALELFDRLHGELLACRQESCHQPPFPRSPHIAEWRLAAYGRRAE
jgi:hypothetical protein